jgi:FKBP-type peptidyl-prolyl cis-trans isomerase FkpA
MIAALVTFIAAPAFAGIELKTDDEKTLYATGLAMARQLSVFNLTPKELEIVQQGLNDGSTGKPPLVNVDAYKGNIQKLALSRRNAQGEKLNAKTKEYLEQAVKEKGAVKTASGLVYVPLKEGTGAKPAATDKVKVNYRGTLIDGKEFDSSYGSGQPLEFQLDKVIKCWTEGVQLMKAGGKARLVCPPDIAYGPAGSGVIPANATLVFEVELLSVGK